MYKTEVEARKRIEELCKTGGLRVEEEPYVPLYNKKKDFWIIYPKVATLELHAMRTSTYAGKSAAKFLYDDNDKLLSATVTVKRLIMDNPCKFASDPVQFDEYAKLDWHKDKPHMFMGKIALARALRHAFPDLFATDPTVSSISHEEIRCELNFGNGPDVEAPKGPVSMKLPETVGDDVFSLVQGVFKK